jgi:spermidine/putrescine transport system substrate-binding protein
MGPDDSMDAPDQEQEVRANEEASAGPRLSRQQFLERTGAFGLSLSLGGLLAACGGNGEGGTNAAPATTGAPAAQLEDEINVIAWAQEWEFAVKPFEKQTGVKVNMTFQDSDVDSVQKARRSPGDFDIISYGPNNTAALEAGVFEALDTSRLEHWNDLPSNLRETVTSLGSGEVYNVPFYWGGTILARQTKLAPESIDSWGALWDPTYKGNTAFIDEPTESYFPIWIQAGVDPEDFSDENFERSRETGVELVKNLKTFWSTGTDVQELLARGEVAVTNVWDGTIRALIKEKKSVEAIVPTEGIRGWIDGPGILADAPHPNAAYAWINYVSTAEVGAELGRKFAYTPANVKAFALLDTSTQDLLQASQMQQLFDSGNFRFINFTADATKKLNDWWSEVKLAA